MPDACGRSTVLARTGAVAGAWLRETGTAFLSLSGEVTEPDAFGIYRQDYSLYAEYGLVRAADPRGGCGHDMLTMSKGVVFARLPLGRADRTVKLAVELGAGQVGDDTALRPGLSIGRGITLWDRGGWLNADGRAVLPGGGAMTLESDLTFGLSVTGRSKVILQIQAGQPDTGDAYAKFAPSFVYETKPRHASGDRPDATADGQRSAQALPWSLAHVLSAPETEDMSGGVVYADAQDDLARNRGGQRRWMRSFSGP